jgi:CheY-specific phosphatase CheX
METEADNLAQVTELATDAVKGSIVSTFMTMANMQVRLGVAHLYTPTSAARRSICGVIGWVGPWTGTGIMDCSPEFACLLASLLLGTEEGAGGTALSEDALDAVAEMTNIIFGGMKTVLEGRLGSMGLSTPTVIYGNDVGMRGAKEQFTVIPVETGQHELSLKLYMTRRDEKRNGPSHFWGNGAAGAR